MEKRDKKLQEIIAWSTSHNNIRAVLLTSSLVNPYAPVDDFSDLDIELVVNNFQQFIENDEWLSSFGKVISKVAEAENVFNFKHAMRMVLYDDHIKVDFKIYSVQKFAEEVNAENLPDDWDVGYKILLDKDGLTLNMKKPTYDSIMIKCPDEATYTQIINDFWWDMTYVAKCLVRDDIFYAKFMSEDNMRSNYLQKIIEWYIGTQHGWNVTTNKHGRLFKKYLSPELWQKIEKTFSGSDIEDNWRALFAYADVLHEIGIKIAEKLHYPYPHELEINIREYLTTVKKNKEI